MLIDLKTLESDEVHDLMPNFGGGLADAASVCLDERRHSSPTAMEVHDGKSFMAEISWIAPTDRMRRTWNDAEVATEYGAYGIAALIIAKTKSLRVMARARKGDGFDFWLAPPESSSILFQDKTRLEVSGIRAGTGARIAQRVKQKLAQTKKTAGNPPAVVVVVEFGKPQTRIA